MHDNVTNNFSESWWRSILGCSKAKGQLLLVVIYFDKYVEGESTNYVLLILNIMRERKRESKYTKESYARLHLIINNNQFDISFLSADRFPICAYQTNLRVFSFI